MKKILFKQVAVIGVGLLGGSLIRGLRPTKTVTKVVGVCRTAASKNKLKALRLPCELVAGFDTEVLSNSNCIVLAMHVKGIANCMKQIAPFLKPGTVVMDLGSTKVGIQSASKILPKQCFFVGCHPMAGAATAGALGSKEDLFRGKTVFVEKNSHRASRSSVTRLWKSLGAKPVMMDAKTHDRIVAKVSHLPRITSAMLLHSVNENDTARHMKYAGSGLKSLMRLSGANPAMWAEILDTNRKPIQAEIRQIIKSFQGMDKLLKNGSHTEILGFLTCISDLKKRLK